MSLQLLEVLSTEHKHSALEKELLLFIQDELPRHWLDRVKWPSMEERAQIKIRLLADAEDNGWPLWRDCIGNLRTFGSI